MSVEEYEVESAAYKANLRAELEPMDKDELKKYAKEHGVTLYTTVKAKMIDAIVSVLNGRYFHGWAFRD